MSKQDDFDKAHQLVIEARTLTTQHLDLRFYDFVLEDFDALLLTLHLLAKEATTATPTKTGAPHDS